MQELFEEYYAALRRPGTPLKTFRIRVYALPALEFEALYNSPDSEEVEAGCVILSC